MSRIKGKDTKPELIIRKILFKEGFRYRIHKKDLPGKPDIVLKKYKTVIFVHGCFWHKHENCKDAKIPKTNTEKWIEKIDKNKYRDIENERMLNSLGWNVIIIWECEVNKYQENPSVLLKKIKTKENRPDNMER